MRSLPFIVFSLASLIVDAAEPVLGVRLVILDLDNKPVPCRIHLKDSQGAAVNPNPKTLPFWSDHFVCGGEAALSLPPGDYSYEIERGPEYKTTIGRINLKPADTNVSITNHLTRIVSMTKEGWWPGDLHIHRPIADIPLLLQAEDLSIAPVMTWWNKMNQWSTKPLPANTIVRYDGPRFAHLLAGEDERNGGALLFFNLKEPLPITGANREYPSPMKFLTDARSHPGAWADLEKPFWYDTPVWLASGLLNSVGIAHNHMHRSGIYPDEAWGRQRDRKRLPDPNGDGLWTQEIYYHMLNCGFRIPPSAGSASGVLPNPVGYNRVYAHLDGELTWDKWWDALAAGHVFVSNGPLLRCRANSKWPGEIFKIPPGQELKIQLEAAFDSRDPIKSFEIVRDGRVERTVPFDEWQRTHSLGELSFQKSGWLLVRTIADVPHTFRFASTAPFYVEETTTPRRISKSSTQFFLEWVRERIARLNIDDPQERAEVLKHHTLAENFWLEKVASATAE